MPFSIQTNVNSLIAQENLRVNTNFQSQTIQRLTSGYRINQSGDDAAGLAVANKFRSDIAELTQGVRNANDGVSQLQIIDGGMNNIGKMLDRLKTLATQSASDSFTGDRGALNTEYQTLVGEISRQAQTIGLNQGGGFARNLSIYLGGGTGASAALTTANGTLAVDLSKSVVDAQALGLKGVQTSLSSPANLYDLSASSTTSVQAIATQNAAALTNGATTFTLVGPGFGDANGINISVNMNGVGDTKSLISAVNAGIQAAGNLPTGAAAALKAANITASISTDSNNRQQLSFNSSSGAFTVRGGDAMANALLGSFTGANHTGSVLTGVSLTTASNTATAAQTFAATTTLTISGGGMAAAVSYSFAAASTQANAIAALKADATLAAAGFVITGGGVGAALTITNNKGDAFNVTTTGATADTSTLTGVAAGVAASSNSTYVSEVAGGSYELATTSGGVNSAANLGWTQMALSDSQSVTFAAHDASGGAHYSTVTLSNSATGSGSGSSIDAVIDAINSQLQQSNDSTLQQITAVKINTGGAQSVNFISTLSSFEVSTSANTTANKGLNPSAGNTGASFAALQVGSAAAADISTTTGATSAVSAITAAIKALGTAQAAVGKGQNQLGYAINLASSQISNFSAAQAQIRDADVAAEAANLTKASVLQQASMAAMAQANSAPQAVLTLLRG
ncbi:MAG TPA: flagellin [Candidatus Binataceae bacterium]|jgi:flagellin|nr:flagellin [Candidatus Binataceae bacterium]